MQSPSLSTYKNFNKIRLFIFDLDGTLYDQKKLRRRIVQILMLRFFSFSIRPIDLKIISSFRKQRENHKGYSSFAIEKEQYQWCADELKIPVQKVEVCILKYMYKLPLKFILSARYPNIEKVFNAIKELNFSIAIYSDYPVQEKLDALHLEADVLFNSIDNDPHQLKPSGKAVDFICSKMNISRDEALLIGDREDTDGESARLAGVPFLKVDVQQARNGQFYTNFLQKITTSHGR